jgi:hypothetical protein
MRRLRTACFAAVLSFACTSKAAEQDPKTLYKIDTTGTTTTVKSGTAGKLVIAIQPQVKGAHVKSETPFRGKLTTTGAVAFDKADFGYKDMARVVNEGPVFELPFKATAPGASTVTADLTFFVCTEQACMRTTDQVKVPVTVQ